MKDGTDIKGDVQKHSKYFFTASFILLIILSIYLIKSFIIPIISALILAYIFYPLHKKIKVIARFENVAAILTSILIIFIILVPVVFVSNALINESILFFKSVKSIDLTDLEKKISSYTDENIEIDQYVKDLLNNFSLSIARNASNFVITLPKRVLGFFAMFFIMFYLFKQGPKFVEGLKQHVPLKDSHKKDLIKKFDSVIYASLYGLVITAIIQGVVGAIGLWIFDVPSPILWGGVMVVLAMIPFVGPLFVWVPAAFFKLFVGDYFNGIGLFLYGIFIISTIDNFVRPSIVGSRGRIHPVSALLGVLGGIEVFGLLGIIIGPLILSLLLVFLDLYLIERKTDHLL